MAAKREPKKKMYQAQKIQTFIPAVVHQSKAMGIFAEYYVIDLFTDKMETWSREVQKLAKVGASAFTKDKCRSYTYKSGKKVGTKEFKLRNKIQYQLKSDGGEVAGVAFQFPVHDIFREYGVGRGTPHSVGISVRRLMSDWFSGVLNKREQDARHCGGTQRRQGG